MSAMTFDLVIRNGALVDGTGGPARHADIAIVGDWIAEVGDDIGRGRRELDADGLLVTPGFVDPHTHYDGQATWDPVSGAFRASRRDHGGHGQLRRRVCTGGAGSITTRSSR